MRENEGCARNRWACGRVIVSCWSPGPGRRSIRAGLAQRARIVLLAADGVSNTEIADRVGVSRPTVIGWRDRYASSGVKGLEDEQTLGPAADGGPGQDLGRHADTAAGRGWA